MLCSSSNPSLSRGVCAKHLVDVSYHCTIRLRQAPSLFPDYRPRQWYDGRPGVGVKEITVLWDPWEKARDPEMSQINKIRHQNTIDKLGTLEIWPSDQISCIIVKAVLPSQFCFRKELHLFSNERQQVISKFRQFWTPCGWVEPSGLRKLRFSSGLSRQWFKVWCRRWFPSYLRHWTLFEIGLHPL